jgi:hypothetical protein
LRTKRQPLWPIVESRYSISTREEAFAEAAVAENKDDTKSKRVIRWTDLYGICIVFDLLE